MSDAPLRELERDEASGVQDEIDVELRSPVEIRTRILILASLLRRLALEAAALDEDVESIADAFDEREWLREQGLAPELTPREARFLDSPVGSIGSEAVIEASWQGEALVVLGWAIGAGGLPPIDTTSNPRNLIERVPRPWEGTQAWLADPAILSESEVVKEREIADIWHWRVTAEVVRREGPTADSQEYEEAIGDVAAEALGAGLLAALSDGDFPVAGRSIRDTSDKVLDELVAVTGQRLRALNWLCGFGASWDVTPLDV